LTAGGSPVNAAATAAGLTFNQVTLKWRAALLFGGQLILVTGGVIAMLLLQQVQHAAVATAGSARQVQVLEADYFAGMTQAESGLQEYIDTGDPANLDQYYAGLAGVSSAGSALRQIKADGEERFRLDQMFAEAESWQRYATRVLSPLQYPAPDAGGGDAVFASYTLARESSTAYLETVVAKADAAEVGTANGQVIALAAIGSFALLSVISGGVLIHRSTLRPIGRLIRAARELAAGGRAELPPSTAPGEIGDLSRALHTWQRSSDKRTAIGDAMHEVSSLVDRDEIIRMSLERLLEVSDAAEVGLLLTTDAGTTITTMTAGNELLETHRSPGSPLEALTRTGASLIGDFRDEVWPEDLRGWASRRGHGPLLVVAMVSGSKAVGSVAATRSIGRPAFDPADVGLVEAIANPLAAAIRVAGLFDEVKAVSAQLDIVSRHKTEFLSGMSHELRTPLNSILGFADLLVTPGFDPVTPKQARYIANIRSNGVHLASLIDDALDLAKVESGKAELEVERVDVGKLIAQVAAVMQPLATSAQVKLAVSARSLPVIAVDRRKLHQVLLNLLSNAIKFTPAGGSVTIVARRSDDFLQLSIVDTGIGIAPEDQERIFGAFEQVSGANRDGGGTGLGLALARQHVELHGGRLWLESTIGEGSSFHLTLPLGSAPNRVRKSEGLASEGTASAKMITKSATSNFAGGQKSAGTRQPPLIHASRGPASSGREP
jgi:signal transduction histidine kinase/HAMP domain-containing protein